ncbi:MAG: hypothetical protein ACR2JW_20265 [Thermomicrobiales bacterium]
MNQTPPSPPTYPNDASGDTRDAENVAAPAPFAEEYDRKLGRIEPESAGSTGDEARANEGENAAHPPPSRPSATPPPLPTFGAPQAPPRPAPSPLRGQEMPRFELPQPQSEQPAYPPRVPAPQPAPPGGMSEPPRPYEGGRYVPPPPIPPSGPTIPARDWAPANTATVATPIAPQPAARASNTAPTALLGAIAVLLLALAVFQGINTFHPMGVKLASGQQVAVQKQLVKPETAAEIKDTINSAQAALNQFQQVQQQAYSGAGTDAQRQATLLQLSLYLQSIIAQQNNDLLLIYQDLNT